METNSVIVSLLNRLQSERIMTASQRHRISELEGYISALTIERDYYKHRSLHLETEVNDLRRLRMHDAPTANRSKPKSINGVTIE
jgi:hypothetical protein